LAESESVGADLDPWMAAERRYLETEVARVETELVDVEVAVETLRVELAHFAYAHHRRLGSLYLRLDELDAEVAEVVAARTGDPEDVRRAQEARARVEAEFFRQAAEQRAEQAADQDSAGRGSGSERVRIRPTKDAQRLYRELARRAHPDLAQDPAEKGRRESFIRRVNDAYANGDLELLTKLTEEWAVGADSAPAIGAPDRLEWLRTRLAWLEARLAELRAEQAELEASPIGQLLNLDPGDPDGLLDRLGEQLVEQVTRYEELLRRTNEVPWPMDGQARPSGITNEFPGV